MTPIVEHGPGSVREPAAAGQFYPADSQVLADLVDAMLAAAPPAEVRPAPDRAYIVPHAGYRYSGLTASYVYVRLRSAQPRRIVLIGPSHFVALDGCAVPSTRTWRTPLGAVSIDTEGCRALVDSAHAVADDRPHASEHSIEVQLPLLQRAVSADVPVLPIAVGVATGGQVAAAIAVAVGTEPDGTVVLCSTDLSHYLTERQAQERDERTIRSVLALGPVGGGDACGGYALRGLLSWAAQEGMAPRLLHRCTSAAQGGGTERVVGYAAFALSSA